MLFAVPFALADAGALVVLFLAFGECNFELGPAPFPVQLQRHQSVALALHATDQFTDFTSVQQQFATARGIR